MKKTSLCSTINIALIVMVWSGLIFGALEVIGVSAFKVIVVTVVSLPVSGYLVQYVLSPVVNRIVMGKVAQRT